MQGVEAVPHNKVLGPRLNCDQHINFRTNGRTNRLYSIGRSFITLSLTPSFGNQTFGWSKLFTEVLTLGTRYKHQVD